ncbi:hypothetical protein [Parafilimonas sp.]|uniref:hypothetical protein n=1 Tax=Parafilimonas sp. TaxID=1969739 RepID=UPI0039E48907
MKQITATFIVSVSITMLFALKVFCQNDTPLKVAEKVADKIIDDAHFEFKLVPQTEQLGIQIIDFRFMKINEDQTAYAACSANAITDTAVLFGITAAGKMQIWLNKKLVYQQQEQAIRNPREMSYGRFHFNKSFAAKIKKGENQFLIKYEANLSAPVVFLRPITGTGDLDISVQFNINCQQPWMYAGSFSSLTNLITPEKDLQTFYEPEKGKFISWQTAPQKLLPELVTDSNAAYRTDPYSDWQYAHGTMVWGIMKLGDAINIEKYNAFAKKYKDYALKKAPNGLMPKHKNVHFTWLAKPGKHNLEIELAVNQKEITTWNNSAVYNVTIK